MRRLLLARLTVAAALVAVPLVASAVPAAAAAPTQTGWWNFAAREGAPQPPAPPDVQDGDLLIQSGDPSGLSVGSTAGSPAPSAVAALRFTVPPGATVGAMSFEVANGATTMDVRAYATTDAWKPVQNGPLTKAPTADRSRFSQGVVKGSRLVFADITRLLPESGQLSVVLLPGTTDRVVLRKPGPDTLAVTQSPVEPGATPTPAVVPPATGVGGQSAPVTEAGIGTAFAPGVPDGSGLVSPALPEVAAGTPQVGVLSPEVAAPTMATGQAPVALLAAGRVALSLPDDTRTRYFAAAEAALVLVTFGLFGWGPFARLSALVGPPRPQTAAPDEMLRGVGRFAKQRDGQVVRL